MTSSELVKAWLNYARNHGLRAAGTSGTEPTVSDVHAFLSSEGFSKDQIEAVIYQVAPDAFTSSGDDGGSDDDIDDEYAPAEPAADEPAADEPASTRPTGPRVSDIESEYDDVSDDGQLELDELQQEELAAVYRIMKHLDSSQLHQLKRELKYV